MRLALLATLLLLAAASPALAEERTTLGVGRVFSNDFFGDGHDRWRTGSYGLSVIRGTGWDGAMPGLSARLLEYRLRTEIIAPANLYGPDAHDRPFAASLSFGVHSHFAALGGEVSAGGDLVATGPGTGLPGALDAFHELISAPNLSDEVQAAQVGDGLHFAVAVEYARPFRIAPAVTLRPYAGAEAGVEDIARVGLDVIWGGVGQTDLWVRDLTTGTPYRGVEGQATGLSLVAGGDWSRVGDSLWLPEGYPAEDERLRARAGIHWQVAPKVSVFYGLAYLSPEAEAQPEGQVTGQLKLNFNF